MRNEFEERLRNLKAYAARLEHELDELRPRQTELAHREAQAETTKGLTKLRAKQKQALSLHTRIHEQADAEVQSHGRAACCALFLCLHCSIC